ncbi:MAG: DUF4142 domain-containing protein [Proteobacteria bacterium]|nr:DUF4142 domain-containing protein [Pseudomonadota bacterium]
MKKSFAMMAMAATVVAGSVWAEGSTETFLKSAIQDNLAEIQMGQMAQQKGQTPMVRALGKQIEVDHSAANGQAVALAIKAGIAVPTAPNKDQQADITKLSKYSGATFDKMFVERMEDGHKNAIAMFEDEAGNKDDGAVATFATGTLPTLRQHLAAAENVGDQLK